MQRNYEKLLDDFNRKYVLNAKNTTPEIFNLQDFESIKKIVNCIADDFNAAYSDNANIYSKAYLHFAIFTALEACYMVGRKHEKKAKPQK